MCLFTSQVSLLMDIKLRRRSKVEFDITEGQRGEQATNVVPV